MSFQKILNLARCSKLLNRLGPQPIFCPSLSSSYQHPYSSCNFTEFSKKTGDYCSLSAVDIQVMGLTYQLEKEHVGTQHLHSEPVVLKVDKLSQQVTAEQMRITGFYMPTKKAKEEEDVEDEIDDLEQSAKADPGSQDVENDVLIIEGNKPVRVACAGTMSQLEKNPNVIQKNAAEAEIEQNKKEPEMGMEGGVMREEEEHAMNELEEALRNTGMKDLEGEPAVWSPEEEAAASSDLDEEGSDEDDEVWDDNAWITPENVEEAKKDLKTAELDESPATVACITSDFAMQNVIRQLGMKAMSVDGRIIKQLRTYILRCYSCFKTTSKMELLFCPHCGNRTLRKTGVLLKPDGTQEVMIGSRKPPTSRVFHT